MSNSIINILDQVETTSLAHAGFQGHVISTHQVAAIRRALHKLDHISTGSYSPPDRPTPEPIDFEAILERLGFEKAVLESEVEEVTRELQLSPRSARPALNLKIGKLQKEIADINRRLNHG